MRLAQPRAVCIEVPSTAYRSPTNRARMTLMDAAQHTAAALRRLRITGRSEPPLRRGRASPKIESAGGGGAKQRSEGSLPVTQHTATSRDFTRSARSGDKAPRPRDSFKRVDLHDCSNDPALAQFVDASSTLRMHTPRESYMRTLQKSHWASDGALNSHGRPLRLAIMTDQDVTVPGASKCTKPRPKHRRSDQWRDQGMPPQAVKPQQADRRSSPAQTVCTAVRRVSVSPQVMNKDQEIALTACTPAVRDQVLPALLDAGLILLMTVAALGLLAGYVLMCNSFHKR